MNAHESLQRLDISSQDGGNARAGLLLGVNLPGLAHVRTRVTHACDLQLKEELQQPRTAHASRDAKHPKGHCGTRSGRFSVKPVTRARAEPYDPVRGVRGQFSTKGVCSPSCRSSVL